jgi:hypothetical protein
VERLRRDRSPDLRVGGRVAKGDEGRPDGLGELERDEEPEVAHGARETSGGEATSRGEATEGVIR